MKIGYLMGHASGPSVEGCHFLALRFDERWGFKPDTGETFVLQRVGTTAHLLYGGLGWYTGLWRSPRGSVYVAASNGEVHVKLDPEPTAGEWRVDRVAGTLAGIWGLDDKSIFTWGLRGSSTVVYRFDGTSWKEVPSPGEIVGMHGISPDLVYAVGRDGLVARWGGKSWTKVASPARGVLSAVFVAAEDEMYAVGPNTQLLQGSLYGWSEVLEGPGPMFGVAKWRGEVWVGAAEHGLMKLAGAKLVPVKPNIKAEKLDAREDLLVSSPQAIVGTSDAASFRGIPVSGVAEVLEPVKPGWVR
jgi:hypothetical protein